MYVFNVFRILAAVLAVSALPQTASTQANSVITLTTRIPTHGFCSPTPTSNPGSDEPAGGATGSSGTPGSNTVLTAAVHWDHDLTNIANLARSFSGILYYSEGGVNGIYALHSSPPSTYMKMCADI